MTPITVGIICVCLMVALMIIRMPIAVAMLIPGFLGAAYLMGMNAAFSALATIPFNQTLGFTLTTVPTFVLMGQLVFFSGISKGLFDTAQKWLGRLPGGLAVATIGACAGFAACTGSSLAGAATMGSVALPEMERNGYDRKLAAGTVAAGGTLGILIPPSTNFVIYGILTEVSIGKLLISGLIPGIILSLMFMASIYIYVKMKPEVAPTTVDTITWKQRFISLRGVIGALLLFILAMGGLFIGLFSPTEAGGVGAFGALVLGLAYRNLTWSKIVQAVQDTTKITCFIFAILISAMILNYTLAITGLPAALAQSVASLPIPPVGIFFCIIGVYIILGMLMETFAMIVITIPIFFPLILALGFDPIWFGVIVTLMTELAMITPPVGMNCYVLAGMAKHIPIADVFKGIMLFIPALVLIVVLLLIFPQIALWLPSFMRY